MLTTKIINVCASISMIEGINSFENNKFRSSTHQLLLLRELRDGFIKTFLEFFYEVSINGALLLEMQKKKKRFFLNTPQKHENRNFLKN